MLWGAASEFLSGEPERHGRRRSAGDEVQSAPVSGARAPHGDRRQGSNPSDYLRAQPLLMHRLWYEAHRAVSMLMPPPSTVSVTVPSRSVRRTSGTTARSACSVDGVGWPYELPSPTSIAATCGRRLFRTSGRPGSALPWCETFIASTCRSGY